MSKEFMTDSINKIKKIIVDRNLCIGAARCVVVAGSVFELNGENKAVMKQKEGIKNSGPVEKENLEDSLIDDGTLILAAQSCPTRAIILYDEDGKQIYP